MNIRANIIVQGMVQGVGFRYFVHRHATQLGLVGYVRNLYSGEVEVEAEGSRSIVEELIALLKTGPRLSRVTNLIINWKEAKGEYRSFEITY